MGTISKAYYRSFQAVFNVGARLLYWRKPIRILIHPIRAIYTRLAP